MSLKTAFRETYNGFKSLLIGMRITAREAAKPSITTQYPHETLKMPDRFRGHVKLILDPATGKSRCTACNLCVRACPSDCIDVEGMKREGEKKKSVTEYHVDFTTCSLCGSCVEACPSDAIEYSKAYNVVSQNREDFTHMDLVKDLEKERQEWAKSHPEAANPVAGVVDPGPVKSVAGVVDPGPVKSVAGVVDPGPVKFVAGVVDPGPASTRPATPTSAPATAPTPAPSAPTAEARPQSPDQPTS